MRFWAVAHAHDVDGLEVNFSSRRRHAEKLSEVRSVIGLVGRHPVTIGKLPMDFGVEVGESGAEDLVQECYANFECRLADTDMIRSYGLFVWDVVKAHVALSPKNLKTLHYRGQGEFMVAGRSIGRKDKFKPQNL